MLRKTTLPAALVALLVSINAVAEPLRIPMYRQEQTNWCWAAVASTIVDYFRNRTGLAPQCWLATTYRASGSLNGRFCCEGGNASSATCNQPGSIYRPLDAFGHMRQQINGQLTDDTFMRMSDEFREGRPVPAAIRWAGQEVGHAIIAYGIGFGGFAGGQAVYIWDPTTGRQVGLAGLDGLNSYGAERNGAWRAAYFLKR